MRAQPGIPTAARLTAALLLTLTPVAGGAATSVSIDTTAPGIAVNPHMYGIFFEELNHAGDGGLYAEKVRNRSFEDCTVPEGMWVSNGFAVARCRDRIPWPPKEPIPGWTSLVHGAAAGTLVLDHDAPVNEMQHTALRLDAAAASPAAPFGVANTGYWGMSFESGQRYDLSAWVRAGTQGVPPLVAVLEDAAGGALSVPVPLEGPGPAWRQVTASLTATGTDHAGRLALYAQGVGTVWLDVVSLFPRDTHGHRPNGLRADLVELLKDMQPGFLRFPGGCVTEGLTLEQGFDWKRTIGPIAGRPGVWNAMWGYRRTDGLGYHEMLQLAEDVGATALFCNNMGIACTIHTPGGVPCPADQVSRYVDDTLDAIEYARGGADSRWGAVRARNGHPAPFDLSYVNIGNELNCREYTDRYPAFHKAVKARYPDIVTIAYAPVGKPRARVEIKDLHDYRDEAWFLANMARFDGASREGPRLSTMEFAARNAFNGSLRNALLEAAYMIGLERNADLVRLVAYAPLFRNVNHPGPWQPVLIHFDNHRAYVTPSYHVQKLFMRNRPDVVLPTTLDAPAPDGVYVLAGQDRAARELVIKAVNLGAAPQPIEWRLNGVAGVAGRGSVTVLTAPGERDVNSLEQPARVAPAVRALDVTGHAFAHELPPHSFSVLRIPMSAGH